MDDVAVFHFYRHAEPRSDEWDRFFDALADGSPIYLVSAGRVIGCVDADAMKRRLDARPFFPPILVGA